MSALDVPGFSALQCVISSLRDTAHFTDEEGDLTDKLRELRDWICARAALAAQPGSVGEPMASVEIFRLDANINGVEHQLVEFVRYEDHARVVHDLETICDPASLVRENAQLRDTNEGLQRMYRALAAAPTEAKPVQDAVDAERYRFVISHDDYGVCLWHTPPGHQVPGWFMVTTKELDAAISAKKGQP